MNPQPAGVKAADALASLHALACAAAGERPWGRDEFARLLAAPGTLALLLPGEGFVLARAVAGEAEILTLAVAPACQRQGRGGRLLDATIGALAARGARALMLEVAADNTAALALYAGRGFRPGGRRPAYYARAQGPAVDAVLLARALALPLGDGRPPPARV